MKEMLKFFGPVSGKSVYSGEEEKEKQAKEQFEQTLFTLERIQLFSLYCGSAGEGKFKKTIKLLSSSSRNDIRDKFLYGANRDEKDILLRVAKVYDPDYKNEETKELSTDLFEKYASELLNKAHKNLQSMVIIVLQELLSNVKVTDDNVGKICTAVDELINNGLWKRNIELEKDIDKMKRAEDDVKGFLTEEKQNNNVSQNFNQ